MKFYKFIQNKFIFGKFVSSVILTYGFVLCIAPCTHAASDGFGRLFTTPEERKKLQELRYSAPKIEETVEVFVEKIEEIVEEEPKPRDIERITLNGLVYRKDNKSTAWLNGSNNYEGSLESEYFRINTNDIDSEKVSVTVPKVNLNFDLKVGQTYELNNESLLDIVENDDDRKISILKNSWLQAE